MSQRRSLRSRVAIAFAVFGAAVSLLLSAGLYLAARDVGQRLMDETLRAELDDYVARRGRNPRSMPPATASLQGHVVAHGAADATIPAELRGLPPGMHSVAIDGRPYRLAISDSASERFYMLFDETRQRDRERLFAAYMLAGISFMTLLSAAGGWWLAGRVIAPVTELAELVASADPAVSRIEDLPHDEIGDALTKYLARLYGFIDRERSFTAHVSHELRTPVAVIQGALEVLLDDPALSPPLRQRLERIDRAAHDMSEIIPALLLLAREERGRTSAAPTAGCDVAAIVRDSVDKHRLLVKPRGAEVELVINAAPKLDAEPALLAVVVGNLIRNALAFTPAGQIRVSLDADRLSVIDTGRGMGPEDMRRLFQRFHHGADSQGSGIGLSLVKQICDRYRWDISIDSREGQGTSVVLSFRNPQR
jgi:signal transduction histidine kinase